MKNFDAYSYENVHFYDDDEPVSEMLLRVLEQQSDIVLADIGCGDGSLLFNLKHRGLFKHFKKVYGVDLADSRLKILKKSIPEVTTLCSNAERVDLLENESIDFAISTQVIEHVESDEKMIDDLNRILSRKGILYISSVVKKKYTIYIYRNNGKSVLDPTHLREYSSKQSFSELIERRGFNIINSRLVKLKFSLVDLFIKGFIYLKIIKPENVREIYMKKTILKKLRAFKIPIIGYYIVEVLAEKG